MSTILDRAWIVFGWIFTVALMSVVIGVAVFNFFGWMFALLLAPVALFAR